MKKLLLFFLIFQGFCLSAQNIIRNGDFSEVNLLGDTACHFSGPGAGVFQFENWDSHGGFFHYCNASTIRFRDRDTIWVPGGMLMPIPKRGDGYTTHTLMHAGGNFNKLLSPYVKTVCQTLETPFEKDSNYVFEMFIRPNPTNRFRAKQFSLGFLDYVWLVGQGLGIDTSRVMNIEDYTLDQYPPFDQWTHVRIDFVANGDEKMLVLHNNGVDTSLVEFLQNPYRQPPQPGNTFTHRAHFLIDDVHLYKASDTIFHVDIGNDTLLCDGAHLDITATPEGFKLEDTVTTWMWSTGDTTPTIRVHDPGTYWVEVRINHTYWARDTIVVEYEEFPEWPKPFGDVLEQCNDVGSSWEEVNGPELKHGGSYFWSTGSDEQTAYVSEPGIYWLEIQTPCYVESDTFELKKINCIDSDPYIPSAFTPGGLNPLWIIAGLEAGAKVEVFNRWGQRVFHSEDYRDNWWDGTHNGEPLPVGVYTYRIVAPLEGRDPFDRIGTVTIVR